MVGVKGPVECDHLEDALVRVLEDVLRNCQASKVEIISVENSNAMEMNEAL